MRPAAHRLVRAPAVLAALGLLPALALAGCLGSSGDDAPDPAPKPPSGADRPVRTAGERIAPPPTPRLRQAKCPPDLSNCSTANGRIIYVERVDPDGDGDAHFVLMSSQSITLPGISVIDVEKSLRPHPLPEPGDRVSAAGPVYRGSYGQKQIQAIEVRIARAARSTR
jgi:hypothetical protein